MKESARCTIAMALLGAWFLLLTPPELPRIQDVEASRYVTLRFLLRTSRLAFISVWSPSFLTLLLESLDRHASVRAWEGC